MKILVIISCISKYQDNLLNQKFLLRIDYKLAKEVLIKDFKNLVAKEIFSRWQVILSIFDFDIEHIKGDFNFFSWFSISIILIGKIKSFSNSRPPSPPHLSPCQSVTPNVYSVLGTLPPTTRLSYDILPPLASSFFPLSSTKLPIYSKKIFLYSSNPSHVVIPLLLSQPFIFPLMIRSHCNIIFPIEAGI